MPQETIDQNQLQNQMHTMLLIFAMIAILGVTGFFMYGLYGFLGAVAFLLFGLFFSGRASAAMILRMYRASPIGRQQAPQLVAIFEEICQRADLDFQPRLFYIPSRMPNAFAVGTGVNASVAVTDGLIRMMNPRELAGVLAHEVAHVRNGDIRVMTLADGITRTTSTLARIGLIAIMFSFGGLKFGSTLPGFLIGGLIMIGAPAILVMLQLAVSRTREFNADQGAAELTGDPYGLASALSKLERPKPKGILGKILRPGMHRKEPAMLRTHPPTDERVEKLMELVKIQQQEQTAKRVAERPRRVVIPNERIRKRPRYHILSGLWR